MLETLAAIGRVGRFGALLAKLYVRGPRFVAESASAFAATAYRGLLPCTVIVASFGAVVALQGLNIFQIFGTEAMLPSLVVIAILREAAPTFTAITMAAQAGSTVAAELAVMRVKEEIDATEVMSVDPIRFHVLPRIVGLIAAAPVLTMLSAGAGIAAAWVITVRYAGVSTGVFRENMFAFLNPADLFAGLAKSLSYGAIIGVLSTYQGWHSGRGARGVGEAANRAVVLSIVAIVIVNYILTSAIFGAVS
jgi:phospholipid/cholesterol/gamma-HCH transport system permease protein